jgi:hypothetical protein
MGHYGGVGPLQNERRDIRSTTLGKEEMVVCIKEQAVWHVDSLLGNDHEISNYTTVVAKQQLRKQACFHSYKRTLQ